jgi:UDP-N-acetylmuramoyl-L-alanyl-D-glutamate--2,6-diaminopimelate ligase
MRIQDVLTGVPFLAFYGREDDEIKGISYSSLDVGLNHLFAALKGEKTDGNEYIDEALNRGAVAVLTEKPIPDGFDRNWIQVSDARAALALCSDNFYSHPSRELSVTGITGTKGKTTTVYLLENILRESRSSPGVIGTISYRGPDFLIPAKRTTPEAPDLQRLMRNMVDHRATHCVMEVSSHSLDLQRVMGIEFEVVVFTNLSSEHMDYHASMERYFEAKRKLFFLNQKKRKAVINADDPWGIRLISELEKDVVTYGLDPSASVVAEKYTLSTEGIHLRIRHPEGKMSITSPLLGKPNLYNILSATAAALALTVSEESIQKGVASLQGVPGRFERIENSKGVHIFVDYAHTHIAMQNLLETVRGFGPKKIFLVFGAGGDRDKGKRGKMGEIAGRFADWSIITSDNPRSEDPLTIIKEIEKGIVRTGKGKYEILADRRRAIAKALSLGKPGDYILVAGKGHESTQLIKDKIFPFSDAGVIRELLEETEGS